MVMKSLIAELEEALLTPQLCRPMDGKSRLIATLARVCIELNEQVKMAKHRSLDPHVEAILESRTREATTDANASPSGSRDLDRKAGATATPIAPPPAPGAKSGPFTTPADFEGREAAAQLRRTKVQMHRGSHFATLEAMDRGGVIATALAWLLGSSDLAWLHADED